jgi:hypothetical protein
MPMKSPRRGIRKKGGSAGFLDVLEVRRNGSDAIEILTRYQAAFLHAADHYEDASEFHRLQAVDTFIYTIPHTEHPLPLVQVLPIPCNATGGIQLDWAAEVSNDFELHIEDTRPPCEIKHSPPPA